VCKLKCYKEQINACCCRSTRILLK